MKTPTFAVLGAVNHGKSSVVSTLSENDQVRISSMPGETVENQRFSLGELFAFFDTPGFQNAFEALEELQPAEHSADPLSFYRAFLARHDGEAEFEAECQLFRPVVEGAGIIYVVDGSRPVLELNVAEMKILRLTGRPRLAIINRTGPDDFVGDWKRRLALHFNAVREFNAHRVTFHDRIELLETLAHIEQSWQPKLKEAVQVLRAEWAARHTECAELMVAEIVACLRHRESAQLPENATPAQSESLGRELKEKFMRAVTAHELRAHEEIIALFGHSLVKAGGAGGGLFATDLFSEETWQVFGLEANQLLAAGAVTGALAGAATDLMTAGHTLALGTAIGAAIGAGSAFMLGKGRPDLSVDVPESFLPASVGKWLPKKFKVGGSALAVGPYRALNFPWILLDRAIAAFAYVINRPHARRDQVTLDGAALHRVLEAAGLTTARWSDEKRKACERHFSAIRTDNLEPEARAALREAIAGRLREVSAGPIDFEAAVP